MHAIPRGTAKTITTIDMASWIVHMRVAELLRDCDPRISQDYDGFIAGSVAPDSGRINPDRLTYTPDKSVTHFKTEEREYDVERYLSEYLEGCREDQYPFLLGYYVHLMTDEIWIKNIFQPLRTEYIAEYGKDPLYLFDFKRDWYDHDKIFPAAHPEFYPFKAIKNCVKRRFDALPFLDSGLIEETFKRILQFYSTPCKRSRNESFKYTTKETMDSFVTMAASAIAGAL